MGGRGAWAARAALEARWAGVEPLILLVVLNLLDAAFTSLFLRAGLATEANPLMRAAWKASPMTFLTVKIALVSLGAIGLWLGRRHLVPTLALTFSLAIYACVVGYHFLLMGTHFLSWAGPLP